MLASLDARLEACLQDAIDTNEVAGCSLLVLKNGEEAVYKEVGYADREKQTPFRRDTIFRCYSMSKTVTSAAAMLLIQDGRLELKEKISDYLPSFKNQKVVTMDKTSSLNTERAEEAQPVLVEHLLHMTSGIPYPGIATKGEREVGEVMDECISRLGTDHQMTTAEFADRIGACSLIFQPGSDWRYGLSADILGALIEKVSGMPYGEFLQKNLFGPLGMKDTGFYVPEEKRDRLASVYRNTGDVPAAPLIPYTGNHLGIINCGDRNKFESGGAGLFSTLDDYAKFTQMLLHGGKAESGEQILTEATINFMTTHKLEPAGQKSFDERFALYGFSYGNLLRVMHEPQRADTLVSMGEYGWDGWLGCYLANLPEKDMTILLGMQKYSYGTGKLTRRLRNIILSEL